MANSSDLYESAHKQKSDPDLQCTQKHFSRYQYFMAPEIFSNLPTNPMSWSTFEHSEQILKNGLKVVLYFMHPSL